MIHAVGKYAGAQRTLDGRTQIIIEVEDDSILDKLQGLTDLLKIDFEKYHKRRSLDANRYLWKLCDLMARKLGSDKDTVYIMELMTYGVSDLYEIPKAAVEKWKRLWKYSKIEYEFTASVGLQGLEMVGIRGYVGSHEYDSKQMAELLEGIKNDAQELGIDTWSEDEIKHAVSLWRPRLED